MKRLIYFLLFVCCLQFNCVEILEFERPDSIKNAIAIQGKLTIGDPSRVEVTLRDVFDFFSAPRFLSAGEVLVLDENGNQLALKTRRQGFYTLNIPKDHPFFKVEFGKKYKIKVENLKGNNFESDFDELTPGPIPDELKVEVVQEEVVAEKKGRIIFERLGFFVDTPLKAVNATKNSRIVWELDAVSKVTDTPPAGMCNVPTDPYSKVCYVNYPPMKNYITFDGTNASGARIDNFALAEINFTNLLAEGYYFIINQQSASKEAFDYWSQVSNAVNRTSDVFQSPAGKVRSNIYDMGEEGIEVYGYFFATEEHVLRTYVSPAMGRFQTNQCPNITPSGYQSAGCCNCLEFESSTDVKPDWWVE